MGRAGAEVRVCHQLRRRDLRLADGTGPVVLGVEEHEAVVDPVERSPDLVQLPLDCGNAPGRLGPTVALGLCCLVGPGLHGRRGGVSDETRGSRLGGLFGGGVPDGRKGGRMCSDPTRRTQAPRCKQPSPAGCRPLGLLLGDRLSAFWLRLTGHREDGRHGTTG